MSAMKARVRQGVLGNVLAFHSDEDCRCGLESRSLGLVPCFGIGKRCSRLREGVQWGLVRADSAVDPFKEIGFEDLPTRILVTRNGGRARPGRLVIRDVIGFMSPTFAAKFVRLAPSWGHFEPEMVERNGPAWAVTGYAASRAITLTIGPRSS